MLPNHSPISFEILHSPLHFLQAGLSDLPQPDWLREYESWWEREGQGISAAVDRSGTPWLRMFDRFGARVDEVLYPPEYWRMLKHGYHAGVLWRVFEEDSLLPAYLGIYVTSFYDPGLSCPYTVSLATIAPLSKYGDPELQKRFLPPLLRRDESVWQGATWMTEIKGGSDLGAAVETVARPAGTHWLLTGDKYFASNAGAELAVVAARPEGAPRNVRGLGLYLVPRQRADGQLNYFIRRIKDKIATRSVPTGEIELRDSEAWLLGLREEGIYLILEVLNLSRVANSVGSVALAQRAMADALSFAKRRMVFGKPLIEQPLIRRQVPPSGPLGKVLDRRACSANREVGHGNTRRTGYVGGVPRRALAARSDDSCYLGGDFASPDSRRLGSDGAQAHTSLAIPTPSSDWLRFSLARNGIPGRTTTQPT